MPKANSNRPTAAKVPERRTVTGARTAVRKPASSPSEKRSLWAGFARWSSGKNPAIAKSLVIVLGIVLAIAGMYLMITSDFVVSHLEAPLPPPPPPPDDRGS